MKKEEYLRSLMIDKYGSVKGFARQVKIPYTTILSILERGISNAKAENVFTICKELGIRPETLTPSIIEQLNEHNRQLVMEYAAQKLKEQTTPEDYPTLTYTMKRKKA